IKALSTNINGFSPVLGSARDALAEFATAAWSLRTRNRVDEMTPVRVIASTALRQSIRLDLLRQAPGDSTFAQLDAMFDAALREFGVTVTWSPDLVVPSAEAG